MATAKDAKCTGGVCGRSMSGGQLLAFFFLDKSLFDGLDDKMEMGVMAPAKPNAADAPSPVPLILVEGKDCEIDSFLF